MEIQKFFNDEVILLTPKQIHDSRGFFSETYNLGLFQRHGIDTHFIQDNFSSSSEQYTFRGMHFQKPPQAQAKLIRVLRGSIIDIIIDIRKDSPTFLESKSFELGYKEFNQLFIPEGFAHGFLTMEANTEIAYKVSRYYSQIHDVSLLASSKELNLELPIPWEAMHLSEKDQLGISPLEI
jgi:dTDP-4-dehydrorhamnose 3,5-epimerase